MNGKKNSFFDDFEDIKKPNKKIFSDNNVFELKDIKDIKDIKKINTEENGKINEYSGFTIIDKDLLKKIKSEQQKKELIRNSAVLIPKNNFSIKSSITSLASTLYYNYFNKNKKFDDKNFKTPLILFDLIIPKEQIKFFYRNILTFLYMSYRSDFTNLNVTGSGNYTTDCGWGCMIRSCQMMLSKALIERKKYNYWENIIDLKIQDLNEIRKKVLVFFLDNNIPIQNIISHNDYQFFWKEYSKLCLEDFKYTGLSEVIAPYSIQTICKVAKCAGKYTSDINMIKAFKEINKVFFDELEIIHFECGTIKKKNILDTLCSEIVCKCNNNNQINTLNNDNKKNSFCDKCLNEMISNNEINAEDILYNKDNKIYIFKKAGIIFISFRLGLETIHPDYVKVIPYLFTNLHHNIGFVSGKENKAFYFIGLSGDELLYVDPHLNQTSIKSDLSDIKSYYVKDIYLLEISEISSELTIGVLINSCDDLRIFFEDIKWFLYQFPDFIRFDE